VRESNFAIFILPECSVCIGRKSVNMVSIHHTPLGDPQCLTNFCDISNFSSQYLPNYKANALQFGLYRLEPPYAYSEAENIVAVGSIRCVREGRLNLPNSKKFATLAPPSGVLR